MDELGHKTHQMDGVFGAEDLLREVFDHLGVGAFISLLGSGGCRSVLVHVEKDCRLKHFDETRR